VFDGCFVLEVVGLVSSQRGCHGGLSMEIVITAMFKLDRKVPVHPAALLYAV
jgi:hypothetical protein